MNIELSIILPVYNVENYLEDAIATILEQPLQKIEVIFINDGSTDGSEKIISKYCQKYTNFYLYNIKNSGTGNARNYGLSKAKGKYIYFMDPDDYLSSELVEDNLKILKKYDCDLVLFGYATNNMINERRKEVSVKKNLFLDSNKKIQNELPVLFKLSLVYSVWNKIYRKDFLLSNNIKFTNLKRGEDAFFNWEVFDKCNSMFINKKIYYNYRINRPGSAVTEYSEDRLKNAINFLSYGENKINSWGMENEFKEFILISKINVFISEIIKLNKIGKKPQKSMYQHKYFLDLQNTSLKEIESKKYKLLLLLLKMKRSELVILIYKIKNI